MKKFSVFVFAAMIAVGSFAFGGGKAHAEFITTGSLAGTQRCGDANYTIPRGHIGMGDLVWRYSQGTCYNGAVADVNGNYRIWFSFKNTSPVTEPIMVYLERWVHQAGAPYNGSWQEVAHTGAYTDYNGSYKTITFTREYGTSNSLYSEEDYRFHFTNSVGTDWTTTVSETQR